MRSPWLIRLIANYLITFVIIFLCVGSITSNAQELASSQYEQTLSDEKNINDSGIPTGEPLLLLVKIGHLQLADVFAIKSDKGALIGLQNLADVLDFAIEVDVEQQTASGWFIKESNTFSLDLTKTTQQLKTKDKIIDIDPNDWLLDDDIYLEIDKISQGFNLSIQINYRALELDVNADVLLPIEQKLARRNSFASHKSYAKAASLPWRDNSYQLFSTPVIDAQILYNKRNSDQSSLTTSIVGAHDLAYLSSRYYFRANDQTNHSARVSDMRLSLFEESKNKDLLGSLAASRYDFGDVQPINVGYATNAIISRGVSFTNKSLLQQVNNETTSFSGDIQPDWDVELYRNKILLESSISNESGRYEFSNIELLYGDNQFELVFYGPQGQVRTLSKQILVEQNPVSQSELVYQVSITEQGRQLFDDLLDHSPTQSPAWLLSGRYDYGLNDWASLYVGHAFFLEDSDNANQISMGSQFSLFDRAILNVSYEESEAGANKFRINARTKLNNQSINFNYFKNITDEKSTAKNVNLSISGPIYSNNRINLNQQNQFSLTQSSFQEFSLFSNSLALYTPWISINNQLDWQINSFLGEQTEIGRGQIQLQKRFGRLSTRLSAFYTIKPTQEFTAYRADLSFPFTNSLSSEINYYYLKTTDYRSLRTNLSWSEDNFRLSSYFDYDSEDKWRFGLSSNISFGYNSAEDIYFINKISLTNGGSILVRVFEDENLNGQYDIGEQPLNNVKVAAVQSGRRSETNELGLALIRSLSANKTTDISIDRESLPDPFSIPSRKGISITPRNGYVDMLDVPIVMSSELEGTVFIKTGGQDKAATYVPIQLLDNHNQVVATTETEYDGYYLFTDIPPGEYQVKVAEYYLKQKKLKPHLPFKIEFSGKGRIVNGFDINLDKYEAQKGFTVTGPRFNSLALLKTYWFYLHKQYPLFSAQTPLFIKNEEQGYYDLVFAFLDNQQLGENYCMQIIKAASVNCQVKSFELQQ